MIELPKVNLGRRVCAAVVLLELTSKKYTKRFHF